MTDTRQPLEASGARMVSDRNLLCRGLTSEPTVAEHAVLDDTVGVLVEDLEHWRGTDAAGRALNADRTARVTA